MAFFRKFAKGLFWVSFIVSLAAVVIFTIMSDFETWIKIVFFLAGVIVVLVAHTGFAMWLELCDNVADMRDKMNASAFGNAPVTSDRTQGLLNRLAPSDDANSSASNDFWYCTNCGTKNDKLSDTCKGCGKYK